MRTRRLALLCAYGCELVALYLIAMSPQSGPVAFGLWAIPHALAACTGGRALMLAKPPAADERYAVFWFFSLTIFFMPVLGLPALQFMLLPSLRVPNPKAATATTRQVTVPSVLASFEWPADFDNRIAGAQLAEVLSRSGDADKRLTAVLMTLRLKDADAVPLLRLALADSEDDVRLLAYALLEHKEQDIARTLHQCLEALDDSIEHERGVLHRQLAIAYWELVHVGLAQGEILRYYLERALTHARRAGDYLPLDSTVALLTGRILLKCGKLSDAEFAFRHAENLGMDRAGIQPFLDEIHFLRQREQMPEAHVIPPQHRPAMTARVA